MPSHLRPQATTPREPPGAPPPRPRRPVNGAIQPPRTNLPDLTPRRPSILPAAKKKKPKKKKPAQKKKKKSAGNKKAKSK